MKKNKITNLVIFILILILLGGILLITKEPSEAKMAKELFEIDLGDISYEIESESEEWSPNGDGFRYVVLNINKESKKKIVTQFNFLQAKRLPVSEELYLNELNDKHLNIKEGFYLYVVEEDSRDFKIVIFDENNLKIVLYNQIM